MATAGWVSLVATGSSLGSNFVVDLIALWDTNYESERWHIFLIYLGFTLGACTLNVFGVRILPFVDTAVRLLFRCLKRPTWTDIAPCPLCRVFAGV